MGDADCGGEDDWLPTNDPDFWPYISYCVMLVCLGGVMSGLQQGLMQLDRPTLHTMKEEASPPFQRMLALVEPLTRRRHLTLVTLLISNAAAMESLPIFFDVLVPKAVAILMSVTLLLIFGEIIPQALCLRWPGELACIFAPLVWLLLVVFLPVSYPISRLLDRMLGEEHHHTYSRAGLGELAREQSRMTGHGQLTDDELDIITGTLELHGKVAGDVCIPLPKVFSVSIDDRLDDKALRAILDRGHSRIPVWKSQPSNIVGLLLVKHLIRIDPGAAIPVHNLQIIPVVVAAEDVSLFALLRKFRTGASHMAVVSRRTAMPFSGSEAARSRAATDQTDDLQMSDIYGDPIEALGIITLEDVIEQLLKHNIEDETDVWKPVNEQLDKRVDQVRQMRQGLLHSLQGSSEAESPTELDSPSETTSLTIASAKSTPQRSNYGVQNNFDPEDTARNAQQPSSAGSVSGKSKSRRGHFRRSTYGSLNEFSLTSKSRRLSSDSEGTLLRMMGGPNDAATP